MKSMKPCHWKKLEVLPWKKLATGKTLATGKAYEVLPPPPPKFWAGYATAVPSFPACAYAIDHRKF